MKDKVIFSPTIAGALIDQGFEMVNMRPDYRDPHKKVYFFKHTPELEAAYIKLVLERKS